MYVSSLGLSSSIASYLHFTIKFPGKLSLVASHFLISSFAQWIRIWSPHWKCSYRGQHFPAPILLSFSARSDTVDQSFLPETLSLVFRTPHTLMILLLTLAAPSQASFYAHPLESSFHWKSAYRMPSFTCIHSFNPLQPWGWYLC